MISFIQNEKKWINMIMKRQNNINNDQNNNLQIEKIEYFEYLH